MRCGRATKSQAPYRVRTEYLRDEYTHTHVSVKLYNNIIVYDFLVNVYGGFCAPVCVREDFGRGAAAATIWRQNFRAHPAIKWARTPQTEYARIINGDDGFRCDLRVN